MVLTAGQATLCQAVVVPQHVGQRAPGLLNQAPRHWHTGSMRKHRLPLYAGRDVYDSHVDRFSTYMHAYGEEMWRFPISSTGDRKYQPHSAD